MEKIKQLWNNFWWQSYEEITPENILYGAKKTTTKKKFKIESLLLVFMILWGVVIIKNIILKFL